MEAIEYIPVVDILGMKKEQDDLSVEGELLCEKWESIKKEMSLVKSIEEFLTKGFAYEERMQEITDRLLMINKEKTSILEEMERICTVFNN